MEIINITLSALSAVLVAIVLYRTHKIEVRIQNTALPRGDKKYKILIVDDDEFMTNHLKKSLEKVGHVATTLNSADGDFVERVKQIKPDLISMDILMPGRNGFEAISLLKQNKDTKRIPVFFLTNLGLAKEINEGLERGAIGYLLTQLLSLGDIIKIYTDYLDDPKNYLQRGQGIYLSAIQNGG